MDSGSEMLACLEPLEQSSITRVSKTDDQTLDDKRILQNLLTCDDQHQPTQSYFDYQTDLRPDMRRIVVSWMVEVCEEQGCQEDVLVAAVNYLDRALTQIVPVKRTQLQLLAATCMFVASKFRDTLPIKPQHLVMYTDSSITVSELLDCELAILQALKWELSFTSPYDFLDQLLFRIPQLSEFNKLSLRRHCCTLIILCTVEPKFLVCPSSLVCAASLCAAALGLLGHQWCRSVKLHRIVRKLTSIDKETLLHYQQQVEDILSANVSNSGDGSENSPRDENSANITPTKSDLPLQRQPCTPTDILDIQLTS